MAESASPSSLPLVRVVVLNFDGGDMTFECLDSILASDWPADRLDIVEPDQTHRLGDGSPDELGRPALRATMTVRDQRAWRMVATGGSAGLGEAYL